MTLGEIIRRAIFVRSISGKKKWVCLGKLFKVARVSEPFYSNADYHRKNLPKQQKKMNINKKCQLFQQYEDLK